MSDSLGDRRDPVVVLQEARAALAFRATERLYEEQPDLWNLGENGRARTLEDFGHHLAALATLSPETFHHHVDYCERLFATRGFPKKWLEDAWRILDVVLREDLPPRVHEPALRLLHEAPSRPHASPPPAE